MTRHPKIRDLATQIEALSPEERLELFRAVLSPEMELRLLVEELSQRASGYDPDEIARDIDETVREVRLRRRRGATA